MKKGVLLCLLLVAASLQAQELYRYKDETGLLVTTDRIPPNMTHLGYEVVSTSGRVLRVVPPTSTEGSNTVEDQKLAEEQQRDDAYILTSFSAVSEIEAQAERKLTQVRFDLRQLEAAVSGLRDKEDRLVDEAAELELAGREVSEKIIRNLADARSAQVAMKARLVSREKERVEVRERYDMFISRFRQLKGITE